MRNAARGRKVQLPEGVYGAVLREQPCPERVREDHEDLKSFWAAETSFRDVTVSECANECIIVLELLKNHVLRTPWPLT